MNNFKDDLSIFTALLQRDLKVTIRDLKGVLFDSIITATLFVVLFGYLLPALGMSEKFSVPLFIGSNFLLVLSLSYNRTIRIKSDLEFVGFIDYYFTLPISKKWLIAEYILSFAIDIIIQVLPSLIMGLIVLARFLEFNINVFALIGIFFASSLFFSIFFLLVGFGTTWHWFINNTWERILAPMMHTGGVYFVWKKLKAFSYFLSCIALLNPLTFIIEGLRSALLGGTEFISATLCTLILFLWVIGLLIPLWKAIHKKMDLV